MQQKHLNKIEVDLKSKWQQLRGNLLYRDWLFNLLHGLKPLSFVFKLIHLFSFLFFRDQNNIPMRFFIARFGDIEKQHSQKTPYGHYGLCILTDLERIEAL